MTQKLTLIPGLPTGKLVEAIRRHLREGDVSRRALAFYLLDMHRRREHQALG